MTVDLPDMLDYIPDEEIQEWLKDTAEATIVNSTKKALAAVSHSDLASKVKATKPKKNRKGNFQVTAYPMGKTKDGKRAADAAFYLHYGTVRQPARPWEDRARNDAEPKAYDMLQKKYEKWVDG